MENITNTHDSTPLVTKSVKLFQMASQQKCHYQTIPTSLRVAVIGAGASGLVAVRELHREGHQVVVFEKGDQVGGVWVYTPRVESDPLGQNPNRPIIHSSLYKSLRTNLPRESMGFLDFPFVAKKGEMRDPRRFPDHREVLEYLKEFSMEFGIEGMVRLECEVVKLEMVDDGSSNGRWRVKSRNNESDSDGFLEEVFDAAVICNGHNTQPRITHIQGINLWPGKQIHSHNYRNPDPYIDQVVIVIGHSTSAFDISIEVSTVAKEVHIASRSVADDTCEKEFGCDNIWLHSMLERAHEDGTLVFQDGSVILAGVIIHCTGYEYRFPFLKTNGVVTVDDNRVGPLYKHVFPPRLAPWLSFVGIPSMVLSFRTFENQSKWIAGVLSSRIMLPSQHDMMEDVYTMYKTNEDSGVPKRFTHKLGIAQTEYNNWIACQCQSPCFEEWRIQMFLAAIKNVKARPRTYRDEWEDDHLVQEALEDFQKYIAIGVGNGCGQNE